MIRNPLSLLGALMALAFLPPAAHAEPSAHIGVVSLYKSNGVDQDNPRGKQTRPAVQGGVDHAFANGLYLGNWNSTGEFGDADIEIDLYGGYRGQLTEQLGYDVGVVRFLYPGSGGGWNGNEAYASMSYGPVTVKYARGISGPIDKWARLSVAYSLALSDALTLQLGAGMRNKSAGDFADYSLGLAYDLGSGWTTSATLSGATRQSTFGSANDDRLILSLVKAF